MKFSVKSGIILGAILVAVFLSTEVTQSAEVDDIVAEKNRQIQELQRQIQEYQLQIGQISGQSRTLENEVKALNAKIAQANLEIRSLALSIEQTNTQIGNTQSQISDAQEKISTHKDALAQHIKLTYEVDQRTLTQVLLKNDTLSDFFSELNDLKTSQENLRATIISVKELKDQLQSSQVSLAEKKAELESLKAVEDLQKRALDNNKSEKNRILTVTKGEESRYQNLVKQSQSAIDRIHNEITFLRREGVTAGDAIQYGKLAATRAGIRPAFLIAILEIESGLGRNVGTGNWMNDMYQCYLRIGRPDRAEAEKNAFLKIVGELGLDPNSVKVSREPNYGCGGAMGPAQFIPTTWLGYKDRVAAITGHYPPSPWNIEDAFTASATKLAAGGATVQTPAGESRAARAYVSGNGNCVSAICNYYSNAVLTKAAAIAPNL